MSELTGKSPGVSTREIDLSQPTKVTPAGVPAGVVGTAVRGPAFVPVTFATFQDFVASFGNTDGEKFGPLAVNEWMRNSTAGTFIRVLGVGDGKRRDTTDGAVTNAGFTVGSELVQDNGLIGQNSFTGDGSASTNPGQLGRTYVLGCFMSESAGSSVFSAAGIQTSGENIAYPIVRGILFAASGVIPAMSSSEVTNNSVRNFKARGTFGAGAGLDAGANLGDVVTGSAKQEFVMLLNGHAESDSYSNVITASFDPSVPNYFGNVFNTDPFKIEDAGHFLYARYDVSDQFAEVTGSGVGPAGGLPKDTPDTKSTLGFLLTSSMGRASSAATSATRVGVPDLESFTDRFTSAKSPFVVSQKFGGSNKSLFRLQARDDGAVGNTAVKITIANVSAPQDGTGLKYGKFDLLVRKFDDSDNEPIVLEAFRGLDLDPTSDNYVSRRIGDTRSFYDFDRKAGSQKLVVEGKYPNSSQYIRVEESSDLENKLIDKTALPTGFRGIPHLVTSGTLTDGTNDMSALTGSFDTTANAATVGLTVEDLKKVVQPPVQMREHIAKGVSPKQTVNSALTWGIQFEKKKSTAEPNAYNSLDFTVTNLTKYLPDFHTSKQNAVVSNNEGVAELGGCVRDADLFNNNLFTLERIEVITSSADRPDSQEWAAARYRRDGISVGTLTDKAGASNTKVRFLDPAKDFKDIPSQKYFQFTFPLQGGFDGLNIFDKQKFQLTDTAVRREMDDSNESGVLSSTVAAFRKAIDVMEEKSDVDIQLLAIPGLRHEAVSDYAIDSVEARFDALYIMDIEQKNQANEFITGSDGIPVVNNTVERLSGRALDSSFAAAYFPDVIIRDPSTLTNVVCPPSVSVLGAFGLNDAIAHPWFAPAGMARGALSTVIETKMNLSRNNLDDLYSADINPIISTPTSGGPMIFGQKTLLATQSALDRVNVRRLLIDVRRKVKNIARGLLFEPNREDTLATFSSAVIPVLTQIQQQQGLDRFKVQIDTSTTTQADVENNTIRGKIFLQPTKSVEFISLDFFVTNAGAEGA